MSVLTVLIDTDVLIDFMTARPPFTESAKKIIRMSHENRIKLQNPCNSSERIIEEIVETPRQTS